MHYFSETLLKARRKSGFTSASAFHRHLQDIGGIDVNYAHYKKMESGLLLPKASVVNQLAEALPELGKELVLAYCQDLFPNRKNLFAREKPTDQAPSTTSQKPTLFPQKTLTARQIATLVESDRHYFAFQLLSLARRPLQATEISSFLPKFSERILQDLVKAKLIYQSPQGYKSKSIETKFPEATTSEIKRAYAQMDQWDKTLQTNFDLKKNFRAVLLRRISARYLPLLQKNCEILADLARSADESDLARNDEVLYLTLEMRSGRIPG